MKRAASACLVLFALVPAVARAESGGEAPSLLWHAVNFLLLIAVIVYFGRKPIASFFGERRAQIEGDLESAAKLLSDAEERLADWKQRAEGLESEVEEIRRLTRDGAEAEGDKIIEDARRAAERIQRDAEAAVDQEVARAQRALRDEAAELATELAEKLLSENVNDGDRERLVDEFVTRIESADSERTH